MSNYDYDEIPNDVREEMHEERQRRVWHWCSVCHGHTGPGSPCAEDPPEEDQDDSDYCGGCNPEPTISELECGKCDSCGKELA